MIVKLQSSRMFVSSSSVITITTSPCRMLPAGTTTTCPCPTRSTPRPGGATTTTRAPCPRAQTGGWRGRGHVPPRVVCRQRCFPAPASNVTFVPMIRWGGLMGDCGEAVCGGDVPDQYQVGAAVLQCCRGPGEVATEFRECSQHLFKHGDPLGDPQSQSPVRIL